MDNVVLGPLHYFYVSLSAVFRAIITWVSTGQLERPMVSSDCLAEGPWQTRKEKQSLNLTTFFVEQ